MSKDNSGKWAAGAFIGLVAGYVAGLLTAPKSGKETREDIKNTANRVISEAEKKLKKVHSELAVAIDDAKRVLADKSGKAKDELAKAVELAKVKQEKVKELLSALRDGGSSDDPELQKSIDDAKSAIEHLKQFAK